MWSMIRRPAGVWKAASVPFRFEGETGLFFSEQTAESVIAADRFESQPPICDRAARNAV